MAPPRLALDLDMTVFPLLDCLRGAPEGVDCETPEMSALVELLGDRVAVYSLFDRALTFEGQMAAGLYPGAVDVLTGLAQAGTAIHVMTHRHPNYRAATERALSEQGLPFVELLVGEDLDKPALCVERGIDIIIDDSPRVIRRALEVGVRPVALRGPHNADAIDELGVEHADSWEELEQLLLGTSASAV